MRIITIHPPQPRITSSFFLFPGSRHPAPLLSTSNSHTTSQTLSIQNHWYILSLYRSCWFSRIISACPYTADRIYIGCLPVSSSLHTFLLQHPSNILDYKTFLLAWVLGRLLRALPLVLLLISSHIGMAGAWKDGLSLGHPYSCYWTLFWLGFACRWVKGE